MRALLTLPILLIVSASCLRDPDLTPQQKRGLEVFNALAAPSDPRTGPALDRIDAKFDESDFEDDFLRLTIRCNIQHEYSDRYIADPVAAADWLVAQSERPRAELIADWSDGYEPPPKPSVQ